MARKGWSALSPSYRQRLERRGVTESNYDNPFFSLQRARGHRAEIRDGRRVAGEKAALERRRRERGALTDSERRFVTRQLRRAGGGDREAAIAALESMGARQRAALIAAQAQMARQYRRRAGRRGAVGGREIGGGQADFRRWLDDEFPEIDEDSELLLYYH